VSALIQRSFVGGEISPSLYARVDNSKYAWGVRTLRNFLIRRHGGVDNRPGTGFGAEVKDSTKKVRMVPFVFSTSQAYCLEFGDLYMRVHKNGIQLTEVTKAITGISNANPCVVTAVAHGFSNGDEVSVSGLLLGGPAFNLPLFLNNRNFKVANVTANTFSLKYMDGTDVNSTTWDSWSAPVAGSVARVYTLVTPYASADLSTLKFTQSADVITLTHPSYPVQQLSRTGDTAWTLAAFTADPSIAPPTGLSSSALGAGTHTLRYTATAVSKTGEESLPMTSNVAGNTITAITQAAPPVVTFAGAGVPANGDLIYIDSVVGMTQLNKRRFVIDNVVGATFELVGEDATSYGAYVSGGSIYYCSVKQSAVVDATLAAPSTLTITGRSAGAMSYNIYKQVDGGSWGLLGITSSYQFTDIGQATDKTLGPPVGQSKFTNVGDYPSTVAYYQQRQIFAASNNHPETIDGSRIGHFKNFTTTFPLQATDAISWQMAGEQVNRVKHLLSLGKLLVFTDTGEWAVNGDASGVLMPGQINPQQYSYNGSSDLRPMKIGGDVLYVQARGSVVRDFGFVNEVQGYRGNDLTVFSAHLFDGFTLVDWAYQQIPHSIVWAVRSDGVLLGLTYLKEHSIWGWHRHDTDGFVENVCVIPEGSIDAIYLVVRRTINGRAVRYVERMKDRRISNIVDSVFMDASLSYDGRNTTSSTIAIQGGTDWLSTETLNLYCFPYALFSTTDVGKQFFINLLDASGNQVDQIRFTVTGYTNANQVSGNANKTVPTGLRNVSVTSWSKAVSSVSGLWHLEGKSVSAFGDGFVISNPNNPSYTVLTVTNGQLTLDKPYSVVSVGLPYLSDIETLDIDTSGGETLANKKQIVQKVTLEVESSRGILAGPKPPSNDAVDPFENLYEFKLRTFEAFDQPTALITDKVDVVIQGQYSRGGRVFIRQSDPVPLSVLAVVPEGMFPIRQGAGG
jgi:hypothetical protein